MKKIFKKYDLQLLALLGFLSGILVLLAFTAGYKESQNLFSALDNLSARF